MSECWAKAQLPSTVPPCTALRRYMSKSFWCGRSLVSKASRHSAMVRSARLFPLLLAQGKASTMLEQQGFRLPDEAAFGAAHAAAQLRPRLEDANRVPPMIQQRGRHTMSLWATTQPCQITQAQHGDAKLERACSTSKPREGNNCDKSGPLIVDQILEVDTRVDHEVVQTTDDGGTELPP